MNPRLHYPANIAGWVYFICALVLLSVGGWVQSLDFKIGMIITEYGLVLLPVLVLGMLLRIDLKSALRLHPLKLREWLLIPVAVVLALPITLFLNMLIVTLMALFGKAYGLPIPAADTLSDLSVLFFIISISAGICEEFFFRGMVLDAYATRFGAKKGIVISAVLFGLFHFNPQNLLGPIFLGLMFGYLVMVTQSLWAGILAHMTNNGVAVLMMYFANLAQKGSLTQGNNIEAFNDNPQQMLIVLFVLGVIALGSSLAVFGILSVIGRGRNLQGERVSENEDPQRVSEIAQERIPGLRVTEAFPLALLLFLYTMVSYYLIILKN